MNGVCPYVYSPGQTWSLASLDGSEHPRRFQRNLHFSSQALITGCLATKNLAKNRRISEEEASKAISQIKVKFWRGKSLTNHSRSNVNEFINIIVKTLTGKNIEIALEPNRTVEELKQAIKNIEGIPRHPQRLIFAGRQLEDRKTLADYGIKDNDKIHLVLRLCGGPTPYDESDLDLGPRGALISTDRVVERTELTDLDIDFDFDVLPFVIELRMDPRHETKQ